MVQGTQWRFATGEFVGDRRNLIAAVRGYEAMGYDVFGAGDHLLEMFAPLTALAMVAEVTERLRVGTYVLCNEFRHPAVVAKELATLDVLTEGRVEVGVGAGWVREEFEQTGLDFGNGLDRLGRLGEAVTIMKRLFTGARSTSPVTTTSSRDCSVIRRQSNAAFSDHDRWRRRSNARPGGARGRHRDRRAASSRLPTELLRIEGGAGDRRCEGTIGVARGSRVPRGHHE
jgi:alkanesulfonate monooxygenase SsuD/methylene tetrahydromethanopterin reductase-like flavin-dependent oxidoreductase (luciferase family)